MKNFYEELINKKRKLCVVGLGYVGMPIAVAFSKKIDVIGFDLNKAKIEMYKNGHDITKEVGDEEISKAKMLFTSNEKDLDEASFYIVAVPTPINDDTSPDLTPVIGASTIVGRHLNKGDIVVYESTVYPGVTEEVCVPILEKESGLIFNKDFFVGYSPERINPGDKVHRLNTIKKIVSGCNPEILDIVSRVYELVVDAGVHRAPTIKVAEAAKVIENSQRDINIAFMNELSIIFNKLGIDTKDVLEAAGTKWNFLKFYPGLVGGHCIGVDPYYLTYKAEQVGYHSQVILSGRRINDGMGKYVADETIKMIATKTGKSLDNVKVGIFGMTFKENCPDARNSKVFDIINELKGFGIVPLVYDPVTTDDEVYSIYKFHLDNSIPTDLDALIFAVSHDEFKKMDKSAVSSLFNNQTKAKIIVDVKGMFDSKTFPENEGFVYWRL